MRTKHILENEGGLMSGTAVIDDFCVVDELIAHPEPESAD